MKKTVGRPSRSVALPKTTASARTGVKGTKGPKGKPAKEDRIQRKSENSIVDEDDDMGSSFLQYW